MKENIFVVNLFQRTLHHACKVTHLCLMGFDKNNVILSTSNRIPTRGQLQKVSHVYFLLQDFWVILLFCQIVLLSDINVVPDVTIVVPWQLSTGSKHDYLFWYCPLMCILFEVPRIFVWEVVVCHKTTLSHVTFSSVLSHVTHLCLIYI